MAFVPSTCGRLRCSIIAPISRRFLIPIFFVALGLQIEWRMLASVNALLAFGLAGVLLGVREVMHRRWLRSGADNSAYLLLCPNLTLVALAANVLLEHAQSSQSAAWFLLAGLFVTVPSISLLPAGTPTEPSPPPKPPNLHANHHEQLVPAGNLLRSD